MLEALHASRYSYLRIRTAATREEVWVAGPRVDVETGARVSVQGSLVMENFSSDSLDRTFESGLFSDRIRIR